MAHHVGYCARDLMSAFGVLQTLYEASTKQIGSERPEADIRLVFDRA
jgi:hypothetical protein